MFAPSGFDANAASPFMVPLQAYFSGLQSLSQGLEPLKGPMRGVARCQLEVLGLMSRRAQAYMEIPSRLAVCATPADLANEQMRFWRTAFEQYAESSQRIMDASGEMVAGFAGPSKARTGPDRDYITFPVATEVGAQGASPRARGPYRRVA